MVASVLCVGTNAFKKFLDKNSMKLIRNCSYMANY